MQKDWKVVSDPANNGRFIVVDNSGKVLDDAQGWGFKSNKNAYRCYIYKSSGQLERDKANKKAILNWISNTPLIRKILDDIHQEYFYAMKDGIDLPENYFYDRLTTFCSEHSLILPYTVKDIMRYC